MLSLPTIGSPSEERLRLAQLLGREETAVFLIRSPSSQVEGLRHGSDRLRWTIIAPELLVQSNSAIPYSQNDGPLWAGKGVSTQVMLGIGLRYGRASLLIAPQLAYSANDDFPLLADSVSRRGRDWSDFVPPWYTGAPGIDLPLRFGDRPYTLVDPGQSSLTLDLGRVAIGGATENQWWGPGVGNGIVMSNQAGGVPHLFLRTTRPVHTRVGDWQAKWMIGGLTESVFFDTLSTNSYRSLSGAVFTFSPAGEPDLTVGVARAVYRAAAGRADVLGAAGEVFYSWETRPAVEDNFWSPSTQQILSLFGRWVFPESGFEGYGEWTRYELPVSLRDLFTSPNHTQGYTLGFGWARPHRFGATRLQGESTFLEYSPTFRNRPGGAYYTSWTIPHGYTHRGQVVGAGIGPGSSSLSLGIDQFGGRYQAGASIARIRWQAEAMQRSVSANPFREFRSFHAWDASLIGRVRGGVRLNGLDILAEYAYEKRYNFLFQNPDKGYGPEGAVDILNHQLRLTLTPSWNPPRRSE